MKKFTLLISICLYFQINAQFISIEALKRVGSSSIETVAHTLVDDAGNIYSTGYFYGTVDFDPGAGNYELESKGDVDVYVMKLGKNGDFIWAKSFGGPLDDAGYKMALHNQSLYLVGVFDSLVDLDPGFGQFNTQTNGKYDIFLSKFDADGELIWVKTFGNKYYDYLSDMVIDSKGNISIAASFIGKLDFDPSANQTEHTAKDYDAYITQFDTGGNFLGVHIFGGNAADYANKIAVDENDNLYLAGVFNDTADFDPGNQVHELISNGWQDIFLVKVNAQGEFAWAKSFGGALTDDIKVFKVLDNKLFLAGWFMSECDFDPGTNEKIYTPNALDGYFSEFDLNGNFKQVYILGGAYDAEIYDFTLDQNKNIYLTGYFWTRLVLQRQNDSIVLDGNGNRDVMLINLNPNFETIWATGIGAQSLDYGNQILVDNEGSIILVGLFSGTVDFDIGINQNLLQSAGQSDIFILKFKDNTTSHPEIQYKPLNIYPNPSAGNLNVQNNDQNVQSLEIFNMDGRHIQTIELESDYMKINLQHLPPSVYLIQAYDVKGNMSVYRWVKN